MNRWRNITLSKTENSPALIHSVQDAEEGSSWQTEGNGGHAENAETDTTRKLFIDQTLGR